MLLKLLGLGFSGYMKDRFNVFDGLIAIVSVIELCLSHVLDTDSYV